MPEPSYLQVDRWFLDGDPGLAELAPSWDGHLRDLAAPDEVPGWALALERPAPARRWWVVSLPIAVAAAALLWVARPPYDAAKGGPDLEILLPEGPWDGRALRAGDAIRLEVHGFASPYVAVVWTEPGAAPSLVTVAARPTDGVLPGAWELDADADGARIVALGLAAAPAGLTAAEALATAEERVELDLE